ncbi:hypothetical protein MIND_00239600 [Mycena indigotica]|uniref:3-carboxymuconate cyclase n=1 Tax=Mycena indigotica TaxID=2126181 RepID=A0A8H6T8P5_9AGAR|nr:uncharacterized protein MIND_00239600 [Mycena indigotica]KAF7312266.1 hypothetical protein MIND_00239600 [Mycena indigotica]
MKWSTTHTIFATLISAVSADAGIKTMGSWSSHDPSSGAVYFLTNEPSGNYVVSAAIGSNGKLTLHQATPAEGVGSHGLPNTGGDPLFSQGSIKASASGGILAAVNSGSNTISIFTIDKQNPSSLKMLGKPIGSGGEFPISVAINKAGNMVCALNGGSVSGVACFAVDSKKATITPIANTVRSLSLNQTTPPSGQVPPGTASHVIFSPDDTQLIVSVKGVPPTPGYLALWKISADSSLSTQYSALKPAKGGLLPFSLTPIPGKSAILATDPGIGIDIFDFSSPASNGVAAAESSAFTIPGQGAVCWSSFSSKTGHAYVIDAGKALVSEISLDANLKPSIVAQYSQGAGAGTIDSEIATVGNTDFLYVLAANATAIKVLSLAPGKATPVQSVDLATPAKFAGLALQGSYLQGMTTYTKVH